VVDKREQAIDLADAAIEFTPIGSEIAYDASLEFGCGCDACTPNVECECPVCRKVFAPHSGRGSEPMEQL
jgi:hypothetical protein